MYIESACAGVYIYIYTHVNIKVIVYENIYMYIPAKKSESAQYVCYMSSLQPGPCRYTYAFQIQDYRGVRVSIVPQRFEEQLYGLYLFVQTA